jgi:aspartate carbamoyltransferase catalytic subunit
VNVSIVGDIAYSRVVRSNIHLLTKMGANVTLAGPPTLMPAEIEKMGVRVVHSLDEALEGAEVVMMLRIQLERQGRLSLPSLREYYNTFGLTPDRLKRASEGALVMHPGPMNRGVEIASDVADGPWSLILDQVTNGVAVRMAVLYLLAGGHLTES